MAQWPVSVAWLMMIPWSGLLVRSMSCYQLSPRLGPRAYQHTNSWNMVCPLLGWLIGLTWSYDGSPRLILGNTRRWLTTRWWMWLYRRWLDWYRENGQRWPSNPWIDYYTFALRRLLEVGNLPSSLAKFILKLSWMGCDLPRALLVGSNDFKSKISS